MTARQIQALRRALKEDTKTFGARFGRSWRTVQEWEQGRRCPAPDVMVRIEVLMASALRVREAIVRRQARERKASFDALENG